MKRPAFQFYPGDWRKDVELRSCSLAARGLWIDLMCVAHECEPYGHLMVNGRPMTPQQISGQIGVPAPVIAKLLIELEANGVARRADSGAVYSKRMVTDENVRNARAEGGKAGAEHGIKGAEHGSKGGRPPKPKGGLETPLAGGSEPPPSSSSSASQIPSEAKASDAAAPPSARDMAFANGVTLLTAAGVVEKNARSFIAAQCKQHGEQVVVDALASCAKEAPVQPVSWLQAHLKVNGKRGSHAGFASKDYREGITEDGHLA